MNKKENILIVNAESTGVNFIMDAVTRGYHPIVMYAKISDTADEGFLKARQRIKQRYAKVADFYDELETYEETLDFVRSLNPKLVLTGSEHGVELGIRLTEDLGLPGNPSSKIPVFTQKDKMQQALKDYGIRYIRGKVVHSKEEAVEFYRTEQLEGCVIKPARGAASVGVHLCQDEEEMLEILDQELGGQNMFGEQMDGILIQERIIGKEYIVNTVSYDGVHRLSSVWKYNKIRVAGGGNVYDYAISQGRLESGATRMVRYAYDVADALGYRYGAIHGEYMIDKHGPILIEVNCRPMGANLAAEYADRIFGHHETDIVMDTYLNPEWHFKEAKKPFRSYAKGVIKLFITPKDMNTNAAPILSIMKHLPSYFSAYVGMAITGKLMRTVDLETSSGTVYLVNEDEQAIEKDMNFLRKVEEEYFSMIFADCQVSAEDMPKDMASVDDVLKQYECHGSILVLSNDEELQVNASVVRESEISKAVSGYKWGVLDLNYRENEDIEEMIEDFYQLVSKVRKGGQILVPKRTYWHMPHGVESIEVLAESIGLLIEAPLGDDRDLVILTKDR